MTRGPFLQLGLIMLALVLCVFLPRQGSAVLLVPIGSEQAGARPDVLRGTGADLRLIGASRIPGTLVFYAQGSVPVVRLLQIGLLPIAAPAFLCNSDRPPS